MKSLACCICAVAMAYSPTLASGAIIYDGDWSGYGSGTGYANGAPGYSIATACSDGTNPSGWAAGEGERSVCTTEAAWCNWSWDCGTFAKYVVSWYEGGTCSASAGASASVSYPGATRAFYAAVQITGDYWGITIPDMDSKSDVLSGTAEFGAYQGLDASHWAAVGAVVPAGTNNVAFAEAEANAFVGMSVAQ